MWAFPKTGHLPSNFPIQFPCSRPNHPTKFSQQSRKKSSSLYAKNTINSAVFPLVFPMKSIETSILRGTPQYFFPPSIYPIHHNINHSMNHIWTGWWFALRKIWVRQLGWWDKPNISGKIKFIIQMATSYHQPVIYHYHSYIPYTINVGICR